jgi:hypothetical protein
MLFYPAAADLETERGWPEFASNDRPRIGQRCTLPNHRSLISPCLYRYCLISTAHELETRQPFHRVASYLFTGSDAALPRSAESAHCGTVSAGHLALCEFARPSPGDRILQVVEDRDRSVESAELKDNPDVGVGNDYS